MKIIQSFKESHLPKSFAKKIQEKILPLLKDGHTFTIIAMPNSGVTPFLRFVSTWKSFHTIYLDIYELPEMTKENMLSALWYKLTEQTKEHVTFQECREQLLKLANKYQKVIIILNSFDLLHKEFSEAFFGNLRTLTTGNIVFIFHTLKPYILYNPDALTGANLHIFSRFVYFPFYSRKDLLEIMKLHSPELLAAKDLDKAIALSGGHIQLLQLILRSDQKEYLQQDPYIRLLFKRFLQTLTSLQIRMLKKVAHGKHIEIDRYLINLGIVKETSHGLQIFSPLFTAYLQEDKTHHLAPKERALLRLFKDNKGKILSKQFIIEKVWKKEAQHVSDWALDSVIYRLRHNPQITAKGLQIKSHKKLGYQLIRDF